MKHEADSRHVLNTDRSDVQFEKIVQIPSSSNRENLSQEKIAAQGTEGKVEGDTPNEPKQFTDEEKSLARRYVYVLRSTISDNNTLLLNGTKPKGVSKGKAHYPLGNPQGKQIADLCKVIRDHQDKCYRAMRLSTQIRNDLTQFFTKYEEKKNKADTRWLEKWTLVYTDALSNKIDASNWSLDHKNRRQNAAGSPQRSSLLSNTNLESSSNQAVSERTLQRQRLPVVHEDADSDAPGNDGLENHIKLNNPFRLENVHAPAPWAVPDVVVPGARTEITLWLYLESSHGRTGLPKSVEFFPTET